MTVCEFCQNEGVVGETLFVFEDAGEQIGKIYMCHTCEDGDIREREEDHWNYPCNCLSTEASCLEPGCAGSLS